MVTVFDMFMDLGAGRGYSGKAMGMLPEFKWPAFLRVGETIGRDIGVYGRPMQWNRSGPQGKFAD